jgi:hypothetical protein
MSPNEQRPEASNTAAQKTVSASTAAQEKAPLGEGQQGRDAELREAFYNELLRAYGALDRDRAA